MKKSKNVENKITDIYGGDINKLWGESDPEEMVELLREQLKNKREIRSKGIKSAIRMQDWSWGRSMENLINALKTKEMI